MLYPAGSSNDERLETFSKKQIFFCMVVTDATQFLWNKSMDLPIAVFVVGDCLSVIHKNHTCISCITFPI